MFENRKIPTRTHPPVIDNFFYHCAMSFVAHRSIVKNPLGINVWLAIWFRILELWILFLICKV